MNLERATTLKPDGSGNGRWTTTLDENWQGQFGFFGGYIAALLTRSLTRLASDEHHLLTVSIGFLEPPVAGPAEIDGRVERSGRRLVSAASCLRQAGRSVARAHGMLCRPGDGPSFVETVMPSVPPPEDCPPWRPEDWPDLSILDRYEAREARNGTPRLGLEVADTAGWVRMADPTPLDASLVAFLSDTFMPPIMVREQDPILVPTVELQVSFRVPLPSLDHTNGWFLSTLRSEFAGGGYVEQSGSVWTQDGRLLGRMRHCNLLRYGS